MQAQAVGVGYKPDRSLSEMHRWLTVQSGVVILVSINRLTHLMTGYVLPNEFLRWVDLNNMLVLPLISVIASWLLKQYLAYDSPAREGPGHRGLSIAFIIGVYLLGVSYGNHEVTNYLHTRFCETDVTSPLCQIIIFNDDAFSHWVFFTGFVLINAALLLLQVLFPHRGALSRRDGILLASNALFIGAGIFANLAFETIGLDLYVVALLASLSLILLWRRGAQPLVVYYGIAYGLGLVATAIYKSLAA